jgi:hypothetical protein
MEGDSMTNDGPMYGHDQELADEIYTVMRTALDQAIVAKVERAGPWSQRELCSALKELQVYISALRKAGGNPLHPDLLAITGA